MGGLLREQGRLVDDLSEGVDEPGNACVGGAREGDMILHGAKDDHGKVLGRG